MYLKTLEQLENEIDNPMISHIKIQNFMGISRSRRETDKGMTAERARMGNMEIVSLTEKGFSLNHLERWIDLIEQDPSRDGHAFCISDVDERNQITVDPSIENFELIDLAAEEVAPIIQNFVDSGQKNTAELSDWVKSRFTKASGDYADIRSKYNFAIVVAQAAKKLGLQVYRGSGSLFIPLY